MDDTQNWFLLKHEDGALFGPVKLSQLKLWASEAQISPLDKVSTDQQSWMKAPMLAELEMDYLIEVEPEQFYGPTTLGAIREFLDAGEVTADNLVTNCKDGLQSPLRDLLNSAHTVEHAPVRTSLRTSLQQRIRDLEGALMEERRARETAESRCRKLEALLTQSNN